MKFTSTSVAAAGLILLPAAALAQNLHCSLHTVTNKDAAITTTKTIHDTTTTTINKTKFPTTTVTPLTTVTSEYPTKHHEAKTHTVTHTVGTKTDQVTVTDSQTVTDIAATTTTTATHTGHATTIVASAATTTVKTTSGFVPAATALAKAPKKRSVRTPRMHARHVAAKAQNDVHVDKYCTKTLTDVYATVYKTIHDDKHTQTVHAATETDTIWTTKTVHATATVMATVTHTNHHTTTHIKKITATKTASATVHPEVVSTPAAVKYYAACAADNLLDYTLYRKSNATTGTAYSKVAISSFASLTGETTKTVSGIDTAYDCCAECQDTTDCARSSFLASDSLCELYIGKSCLAQSKEPVPFYTNFNGVSTAANAAGEGYVLSNGLCGSWSFGGDSTGATTSI